MEPTTVILSYWNIHCYTLLYATFIIFLFIVFLINSNRNDTNDASFFSFITTFRDKNNVSTLLHNEYIKTYNKKQSDADDRTNSKIKYMYNDLVGIITSKIPFSNIQSKLQVFSEKYKI